MGTTKVTKNTKEHEDDLAQFSNQSRHELWPALFSRRLFATAVRQST